MNKPSYLQLKKQNVLLLLRNTIFLADWVNVLQVYWLNTTHTLLKWLLLMIRLEKAVHQMN